MGKIQRNDGRKNRKRSIVLKFLKFKDKPIILHPHREKKLWKENIFVNEDFSEKAASIRKGLLQKAKYLQVQKKVAKVVYDK